MADLGGKMEWKKYGWEQEIDVWALRGQRVYAVADGVQLQIAVLGNGETFEQAFDEFYSRLITCDIPAVVDAITSEINERLERGDIWTRGWEKFDLNRSELLEFAKFEHVFYNDRDAAVRKRKLRHPS
jgi:hypothetical protein